MVWFECADALVWFAWFVVFLGVLIEEGGVLKGGDQLDQLG